MPSFGQRVARRGRRFFSRQDFGLLLAPKLPQYQIGRGSYGGLNVLEFGGPSTLRVGNYCSFAAGVQVLLDHGHHHSEWITTYPFNTIDPRFTAHSSPPAGNGDVTIGNDVWVGREAMILSGVTIGDGAVVAARSVVVRDVAPYEIVGGNPAKPIRSRFPADIVARLLALRWWDWAEARIAAAMPHLLSSDIAAFLDKAEAGEI